MLRPATGRTLVVNTRRTTTTATATTRTAARRRRGRGVPADGWSAPAAMTHHSPDDDPGDVLRSAGVDDRRHGIADGTVAGGRCVEDDEVRELARRETPRDVP